MTIPRYSCARPRRRDLVRRAVDAHGQPIVNGLDFLEVSPTDQRALTVRFIHPMPGQPGGVPSGPDLTRENFVITGGVRVTGITVDKVEVSSPDTLVLHANTPGDYSTYTLRLVSSPAVPEVPAGFDPALAQLDFSFKVACDNGLDCATNPSCPHRLEPAPRFSYLAKDYATFRRLALDRMAQLVPGWSERSPADLQVTLVELLAYVADQLSYHQDSVATEAYLGTARRRVSLRRHARLVDYRMHEGSNARAWLVLDTEQDLGSPVQVAIPAGTAVVAGEPGGAASEQVVFETMHDVAQVWVSRNAIQLHTWGDEDCCLPAGATEATLVGSPAQLGLARGDVLILEEVLGTTSGRPEDADPAHRHAVRLSADPLSRVDPLDGTLLSEVAWPDADALPFALCLKHFDDGTGGVVAAAVARGNVVLADHGRTLAPDLPGAALLPGRVPPTGPYRPVLRDAELTHAAPFDLTQARALPASSATTVDPRRALPRIELLGEGEGWMPRADLLDSDPYATDFVVEMEEDRRAYLRFGDGILARSPTPGTAFRARYRVGSGIAGNVGAEALTTLVPPVTGVRVRNPLAAVGGTDPEPAAQTRLDAPQAFRTQERAVTPEDYAEVAQRHPEVARAAATRRWTGSWYTMFITVDRAGGRPVDAAFEADLLSFLDRYRLAGHDVEVDAPRFVPLEIALTICVLPHQDRSAVERALRAALGAGTLPDGELGLFHPDNVSFGEPVRLSRLISRAASVPGVSRIVSVDAFQRYGQDPHGEIGQGFIPIGRLEIPLLDEAGGDPERGTLTLTLHGGV